MPRMTDSLSGPGGPTSLKFAALSVQSYHLDSPPFTGAAVGGKGPLDEAGSQLANDQDHSGAEREGRKAANSPLARSIKMEELQEEEDPYTRSLSQTRTSSRPGEPSRERTSSVQRDQKASNPASRDGDVPNWDLDGQEAPSRQNSSASLATISPRKQVQPLSSATNTGNGEARAQASSSPATNDQSTRTDASHTQESTRRRGSSNSAESETGRPAYTQFSVDVDGQEDAASSTGKDDEVDGDEGVVWRAGMLRNGYVPRQGQTKVSTRNNCNSNQIGMMGPSADNRIGRVRVP